MDELNFLQRLAVWALPVVFAITVHETTHGFVALQLGDPTARMLGRLTLNPIKHIDPIGTVVVPGILLLLGGIIFGWAKPVPITWQNLKHPKRDMALVALGGPASNLLMAFLWAAVVQLGALFGQSPVGMFLIYTGVAGIFINIVLMALNLLPLPPLDGGRVVAGLLPGRLSWQFGRIEPYGFPILVLLLVTGVLGEILWPVVMLFLGLMGSVSGLSADAYQFFLYSLLA